MKREGAILRGGVEEWDCHRGEDHAMQHVKRHRGVVSVIAASAAALWSGVAIVGQDDPLVKTEPLAQVMQRTQQEKPTFATRHQTLLNLRYDLANRPAPA